MIQDRTIYEDAGVFARNLFEEGVMDARDYKSYCGMYEAILQAPAPARPAYLSQSEPADPCANASPGGAELYEAAIERTLIWPASTVCTTTWVDAYTLSPKIIIDTDGLDFVGRPADLARVTARLEPHGLSVPILP